MFFIVRLFIISFRLVHIKSFQKYVIHVWASDMSYKNYVIHVWALTCHTRITSSMCELWRVIHELRHPCVSSDVSYTNYVIHVWALTSHTRITSSMCELWRVIQESILMQNFKDFKDSKELISLTTSKKLRLFWTRCRLIALHARILQSSC